MVLGGCGTSGDSSTYTDEAPAVAADAATNSDAMDDFYEEQLDEQDVGEEKWVKAPDDMDVIEETVTQSTLDEVIEDVLDYAENEGMVVCDANIYDRIEVLYIAEGPDALNIFNILCDDGSISYPFQFDGNEGPIIMDGEFTSGFEVYQYLINSGEKKHIFSFTNNNRKYQAAIPFDTDILSSYQLQQLFSSDMSKMAVSWNEAEDSSKRVGWIDNEGRVMDVSNLIHPTTTGFSSLVPNDVSAIFSPEGYFFFVDMNKHSYCYVDVETLEIVKEEPIIVEGIFDTEKSNIFFLPNGEKEDVIYPHYSTGVGINFGEYEIVLWGRDGRRSGIESYDFIDEGVAVGIGYDSDNRYYVGKYGRGFTELDENGEYYNDEKEHNPIFIRLTPTTDFVIDGCAYSYGKIAFTGQRGDARCLFVIDDSDGESTVTQIANLTATEQLLFWK